MSKSSSRLFKSGRSICQSPLSVKELHCNRSCMLRTGERLMRAGSEGNLLWQQSVSQERRPSLAALEQKANWPMECAAPQHKPAEKPASDTRKDLSNIQCKASSPSNSTENSNNCSLQSKTHPDPQSSSTLPQRCCAVVPQPHIGAMKEEEQEVHRHTAIIKTCTTEREEPLQSSDGVHVDQNPPASERMLDGEAIGPFRRGCKTRTSLPAGHWSSQHAERSLGVLYLQYGQETVQMKMPADVSCLESVHALFATAFPHLTMKMLQSPNMGIYIKDDNHNAYYDMNDIRDIKPFCCLKAYHKDPRQVFHPFSRLEDGKISKEMLYGHHSSLHNQSHPTLTSSNLQGSMSPPVVRSMPSSPSRRTYVGRSAGGRRGTQSGSSTLPRESFSRGEQSSASCSSVILERRDVMPDNDLTNNNRALMLCGDGGVPYPESCPSMDRTGRGYHSVTSSQCGAPPADLVEVSVRGIPGGLPQYRASIKPLLEHPDYQSLHRQKCREYGDSHLPPLGGRTPPMSPHRTNELRMMEEQMCGGWGPMSAEMSPIPCFLRRESDFAAADFMSRSRGSSSSASSVFADSPQGLPTNFGATSNAYSEKISAMEKQIASLAGLVHHALSMGSDVPGLSEAAGFDERLEFGFSNVKSEARFTVDSDLAEQNLSDNMLAASVENPHMNALALPAHLPGYGLRQGLMSAKKQISELRLQLGKLRSTQLSNMETIKSMLMMARQELVVLVFDRLTRLERTRNQRRAMVEEDRLHYLTNEETLLTQLCELERYVQRLQGSSSKLGQPAVTLSDVEKAAVSLRELGEALASLKNEFPELQRKLQSALTLEVEAVRFLKEEPQKLDSMLKRVRALTETLSFLRRQVSGSSRSARADPLKQGPPRIHSPHSSPTLQPRCSVKVPPFSVNLTGSASPVTARRTSTEAIHHDHNTPFTPSLRPDSSAATQAPPGNIPEQSDNLKRNG